MWTCPGCGERLEETFDSCWKCGTDRSGQKLASPEPRPAANELQETKQGDGTITVTVAGKPLTCTICGNATFRERDSLLNTRVATFLKFDWANASAVNYICTRCGYIFWFWAD